jgi:hypothetical protein
MANRKIKGLNVLMATKAKKVTQDDLEKNAPEGTFLKDLDLVKLELENERRANMKLQWEKARLEVQIQQLLSKVQVYKVSEESRRAKERESQYRNAVTRYKALAKDIAKKYKIESDDWGFDPDNGEIIITN